MECAIEVCPFLQILDAPVPQMGEQLPDILHFFSTFTLDPEQVIEVPKFLPDDLPMRTAVRVTQLVEQLVEVPTNPRYALAVVASKLGLRREIRGILSGQGSTASGAALIVDTPVPQVRRGGGGGLQGSRAGQNSTAADVEQIVDIPARTRGLQGIRPGHSSTASVGVQIADIPVPHGRGGVGGRSLQGWVQELLPHVLALRKWLLMVFLALFPE